jgi:lipopolysaccharide transport system ATP-binding protein
VLLTATPYDPLTAMTDIAISVQNLSKEYRIGGRQESYKTLRDTLTDAGANSFRRMMSLFGSSNGKFEKQPSSGNESFWALKGVSVEIKRGEVVGIIGRNGAGKSTLLKILSRITEPTQGVAEVHGRMSSLLEVGTGFHAELSGRENIYLNGVIMGMKRAEIERKFDEIVAFAEVEKFIDTPVKHYSSGMYLRLAFAVAAHLEPEILIVDEVLAVGDASFQKKCLNQMEHVGREGRTVLFVSHNLAVVTRLCQRTVLLEGGKIIQDGPSQRVVSAYLSSGLTMVAEREWSDPKSAPHNDVVCMRAVRARGEDRRLIDVVNIQRPVAIEVEYDVVKPGHKLVSNVWFTNEDGVIAFVVSDHHDKDWCRKLRPCGRYLSTVWIPGNFLAEGIFIVGAAVVTEKPFTVHCQEEHAIGVEVVDDFDGESARGDYSGGWAGVVRPLLKWTTKYRPQGAAANGEQS